MHDAKQKKPTQKGQALNIRLNIG